MSSYLDHFSPVLTPEVLLGPAGPAGYRRICPVCSGVLHSWMTDERGVLIEHAGRRFPCRLVLAEWVR